MHTKTAIATGSKDRAGGRRRREGGVRMGVHGWWWWWWGEGMREGGEGRSDIAPQGAPSLSHLSPQFIWLDMTRKTEVERGREVQGREGERERESAEDWRWWSNWVTFLFHSTRVTGVTADIWSNGKHADMDFHSYGEVFVLIRVWLFHWHFIFFCCVYLEETASLQNVSSNKNGFI